MDDEARAIAAMVPRDAGRVLDLSCEAGEVAARIRERLPQTWVGGIELDPELAEQARAHCDEVILVSAEEGVQYPAGPFDCLILSGVLEELPDPAETLSSLLPLLDNGGKLLVSIASARNLRTLLADGGSLPESQPAGLATRRDILSTFEGAGWDLTSIRALRDPAVEWIPLPLDGMTLDLPTERFVLQGLSAADLEEITASHILLTARPARHVSPPDCTIVVTTSGLDELPRGLQAVLSEPPAVSHEIVLVVGGEAARPEDLPESVRVVRADRGARAGAMANLGTRHAHGRHLVFLHEASVPRPGWLDAMMEGLRSDSRVGAVGSKALGPDGRVKHAGLVFGPQARPYQNLPYPIYRGARGTASYVNKARWMPAASAACMLLPRRLFVEIGGFDEELDGELEDADLCLRIRSRGPQILYWPASVIEHREIRAPRRPESGRGAQSFLAKWSLRLQEDDALVCRQDGTDLRQVRRAIPVAMPPSTGGLPPIVVSAMLYDSSGFADEARNLILALDGAGMEVIPNSRFPPGPETATIGGAIERIRDLEVRALPKRFVHIINAQPQYFEHDPRAVRTIGRCMYEMEGIPVGWARKCDETDEVWLPSEFGVETFARAGVSRDKLFALPWGIDVQLFDPSLPPLPLGHIRGYVFLSVFAWHWRKGWDVLIRAYCEEFSADDDVSLVLKVSPFPGRTMADHRAQLDAEIRKVLDPAQAPHVLILDRPLRAEDMPRLYLSADAYVMPSRGEGWGRPYMEAMALGLPAIGTRFSGNLAFMNDDNSYLLDCTMADVAEPAWHEWSEFRGHRWAEPSLEHLRFLMRHVYEHRLEAAERGARARRHIVESYGWERIAALVRERLDTRAPSPAPRPKRTPRRTPQSMKGAPGVSWQGDQFVYHSLSIVNRELCDTLLRSGTVDLRLACEEPGPFDLSTRPRFASLASRVNLPSNRTADVCVAHQWPPSFRRPNARRWVLYQPWEYGSLPRAWVAPLNDEVDEVWVPTTYVRDCYIRSGIEPDKVAVVPNGVDPHRFHPGAPPMYLPVGRTFRFLFVGGTIHRKAPDAVLDAYLETFTPEDEVCLVVKDFGTESFYRGQGLRERILRVQSDLAAPQIRYIDVDIDDDDMPGLYTACNCLVHPYRGEGFGLPIAEAMACGLPVIVPRHGACLDYCDPSVAYLVPATEVQAPEPRLGELETVSSPWWAEVDRRELGRAMRRVFEEREESLEVGRRASEQIRRDWTWERAAERALTRVKALTSPDATAAHRRKTLSVCMIVKNEEEFLPRCLKSVREVADEIVVVDTGSQDRTAEIAREHGARVHHYEWNDDYSAARNVYLDRATGDWILEMDADETLDAASRDELRRLIQTEARTGYLVHLLSYTDPQGYDSVLEQQRLRLFPRHPAIRYKGCIHVQAMPLDPDLPFHHAPCGVILHNEGYRSQDGHSLGVRGGQEKLERWRGLLERAIVEEPDEPFHRFNLGVTCHALNDEAGAEAHLRRAIEMCQRAYPGLHVSYLPTAYLTLAEIQLMGGRFRDAVHSCRKALQIRHDFADAYLTIGIAESRLGNLDAALHAFDQALECRDTPAGSVTDRTASGWKALLGIAEVHFLQDRFAEALDHLTRADILSPNNPMILLALARVHQRLGKSEEAERCAARAVQLQSSPASWLLLAHLSSDRGRLDEAERLLREALARHSDEPMMHVALGEILVGQSKPREARDPLTRALELDNRNFVALTTLGTALLQLGEREEGERLLVSATTVLEEAVGFPTSEEIDEVRSG